MNIPTVVLALATAPLGAEAPGDDPPPALVVVGAAEQPLRLSADDLAAMPRRTVSIADEDEGSASYEGVPLHEILARAGFPMGENLRGPAMTFGLLVEASDQYRVLFSLAELDPGYTDGRLVLLADRKDGRPIPPPEGPLRLILPDEPRRARWIRMVTTLTLHSADPPPAPRPSP